MIQRSAYEKELRQGLEWSRAVALVGPRQCGKTTLARALLSHDSPNYFDLEREEDRARLRDPALALGKLEGLVVIDEVQRRPDLFPALRVLIDHPENRAKFLILGSATPDLLRQSSETLAGRIATIQIGGFSLAELGDANELEKLWVRGSFPRSFLAGSDDESAYWRRNFTGDFVERDLGLLGFQILPHAMERFWRMLAHYHGQNLNASELARALEVSSPTVKRYLDILSGAFMVRQLQPWFASIKKRQIKSPKVYFRDSGLLHYQLGIDAHHNLLGHPKVGASWEGFVIEQAIRHFAPDSAYFWSTQSDAELDLLLFKGAKRIGIECKLTTKPKLTPSMQTAQDILKLDEFYVVHGGKKRFHLAEGIEALPVEALAGPTISPGS